LRSEDNSCFISVRFARGDCRRSGGCIDVCAGRVRVDIRIRVDIDIGIINVCTARACARRNSKYRNREKNKPARMSVFFIVAFSEALALARDVINRGINGGFLGKV